jgi:hypothetical protein
VSARQPARCAICERRSLHALTLFASHRSMQIR